MRTGWLINARHEIQRMRARMRVMARASVQWAVIGGLAASIWTLPQLMPLLEAKGPVIWLCRGILSSLAPALILSVSISISAESGAELEQRPGLFILALIIAATLSTAAIFGIDQLFPVSWPTSLPARLMGWWLTVMLFGAVFGWAAVLSLRHREDQDRLALLLSRRSLLARQIAQSRLLAARAQIDPEMVARVLGDVRRRYLANHEFAGDLLDRLISYLRLAMNRVREQQPSIESELALVRAYADLQAAQSGRKIDLAFVRANLPAAALPIFLMARQMLDAAAATSATQMSLRIEQTNTAMILTLDLGEVRIPADELERLRSALGALSMAGAELDILHHSLDSGANRYVATASIDARASDRSDR